jgi:protein O-GlcNAc transferase
MSSTAQAEAVLRGAIAEHQAGRTEAALAAYTRLRKGGVGDFRVLHLGGAALLQLDRAEEAREWLAGAVRLSPRVAATRMCLGLALWHSGSPETAERELRLAASLEPANAEIWGNLGLFLLARARADEALACLQRATTAAPGRSLPWIQLGRTQNALSQPAAALASFERAFAADASAAPALLGRGQALYALGRLPESLAAFDHCLRLDPACLEAASQRLLLLNYFDDWEPAAVARAHLDFARRAAPPSPAPARTPAPARAPGPLRVAFLSPDLRNHPVATFLEPLLAHAPPGAVEVLLYHDHFTEDAVSARLRGRAAVWRNLHGRTDRFVADAVLADRPEILVDLAGHTGFNRMPLLARRLAPVQVSYLGYPNTTGLATMDFRFTDAVADPPGVTEAWHTERLIRFSETAWCFRPPDSAPPVEDPPLVRGGTAPVFGSFNNPAKLSPSTVRLWARLLASLPGARLIVKAPAEVSSLLGAFRAAGAPEGAVSVAPYFPSHHEHLRAYGGIDVALDPFPYNGTTTTCEALWMGRPVVTLAGTHHCARVGASLLTVAGEADCIASGAEEYVTIARRLVADPAMLAGRARSLRPRVSASLLTDAATQARRFWQALRDCAASNPGPAVSSA